MALSTKRTAGVRGLIVAGERYSVVGEGEYNVGGDQREAVSGEAGVVGTKTTTRIPFVKVSAFVEGDRSVRQMVDANGATVILELKNGKGIVLRDAWWAGDGNVNASEGTVEARFEGIAAEEIDL